MMNIFPFVFHTDLFIVLPLYVYVIIVEAMLWSNEMII